MDMKNKSLQKEITPELLRELFSYDADTGNLIRIKKTAPSVKVGSIAGTIHKLGYVDVRVGKKKYKAHKLIWMILYGKFPDNQIDHINHNRADNRLENLREVTNQENQRNVSGRKNNSSGCLGVSFRENTKRWYAQIGIDGRNIHLGCFTEYSDAVNARKNAEVLYGFHENHGKDL